MVAGQLRLGVKQIHLARPTVHEQVDHRLGLGMEVRLTRFEVEHLFRRGTLCRLGPGPGQIPPQQRQQCRLAKPAAHVLKKAAA